MLSTNIISHFCKDEIFKAFYFAPPIIFIKVSKRKECRKLILFHVELSVTELTVMSRRQITALYTDVEMTNHIWSKHWYYLISHTLNVNKANKTLGLYRTATSCTLKCALTYTCKSIQMCHVMDFCVDILLTWCFYLSEFTHHMSYFNLCALLRKGHWWCLLCVYNTSVNVYKAYICVL